MTQSNWVNPNGLPADEQITSARDLAILARALLRDFPEYDMYWNIPAIQFGKKYMRNYNTLIGRYRGRRRHEDRLHLRLRLQSRGQRHAQRQAPDRRGARLAVVAAIAAPRPRACSSAASIADRCRGCRRRSASVESLQPINAAPPDLRDEMCGTHRKRPAAEEADEDPEPSAFMLTNLPPGNGKASALLKDRPDAMKAIVVFVGAAKNAADSQFAKARDKIKKLAKGKKAPDAKAATAPAPAAQPATTATVAAPALQTVSSPPAGGFAPVAGQPERAARRLPAATDVSNPSALSYAPTAKPETAPLMAMPDAKPAVAAKPKTAAKPVTKPAAPNLPPPSRRRRQQRPPRRSRRPRLTPSLTSSPAPRPSPPARPSKRPQSLPPRKGRQPPHRLPSSNSSRFAVAAHTRARSACGFDATLGCWRSIPRTQARPGCGRGSKSTLCVLHSGPVFAGPKARPRREHELLRQPEERHRLPAGRVARAEDDDADRQESDAGVSRRDRRTRRQVRRRAGADLRPRDASATARSPNAPTATRAGRGARASPRARRSAC